MSSRLLSSLVASCLLSTPLLAASVRVQDVDADGLPDKLVQDGEGQLTLRLNRGGRRYDDRDLGRLDGQLVAVHVSDLDGDGRDDLYLLSDRANRALLAEGAGFREATAQLGLQDHGRARSVERRDLDGLGGLDLLLHNAAGDVIWYAEGGRFVPDEDALPALGQPAAGGDLGAEELAWIRDLMPYLSLVVEDGGPDLGPLPRILIEAANLQIVNGLGATNGLPDDPANVDLEAVLSNGLGNLIVGYNEPHPDVPGPIETGSHNLLVGMANSFTSVGGLIAGTQHTASGPYAALVGGSGSRVDKPHGSAHGGREITVDSTFGTAVGGEKNVVKSDHGLALGGFRNRVTGDDGLVLGGRQNEASGEGAMVVGGRLNEAVGALSLIAGGRENVSVSLLSAILGGLENRTTGGFAVVSGGRDNLASGEMSLVGGGTGNEASGGASSVTGGSANLAIGGASSISGGRKNVSSGDHASIGGGFLNSAEGDSSVVSGGRNRTAPDVADWVAGTLLEDN